MNTTRRTHPLTGEPIIPLGRRRDGRSIWPILGGSEAVAEKTAETAAADAKTTEAETAKETAADKSAEKDWQAEAEKWKALSQKNEGRAKENADAAKKLAEIEAASATEQEKAVKAARDEAVKAERERTNAVLIRAEVRALAAEQKFVDPSEAVAFVDVSDIAVDDDGNVDAAAAKAKVAELAEKKPHLIKKDDPATAGQAGIGVTGGGTQKAGSLSEAVHQHYAKNR